MLIDEGLELLTEEDCLALLASAEVGRVGVTIGAMPAIFPVNFRVVEGAIVFRTGAGSKLRAATSGAAVIRIEPTFVSGRRIIHDDPSSRDG